MKLILLAPALLLCACAAAPGDAPVDDKRYATGSNIPMRNRDVHSVTPEGFENARNSSAANTGRSRAP